MINGSASIKPVRVAVIGLGYWGPNLLRCVHEAPESELVWACDLRREALDAVTRRYPTVKVTTNVETVLDDESVDAVIVATPVSTHFSVAAASLAMGKHVLVEKPLAASASEALDLIDLAHAQGRLLMPGHTFLYSPPVETVRTLIAEGELGQIYFVSMSRVNLGLHQPDVSVVWDLGPHDFSILRFWLGETPSAVSARSRSCVIPDIPDVAFVNLDFPSDVIAHVELSWLAPSKLRRTTIVGSDKMVVYDDTSSEPVRVFDSGVTLKDPASFGEYRLTYRTGDIVSPRIDAAEPLSRELSDFCRAIRTGSPPRSTAELGLEVIRIIEAVDESLARNGTPAELERPALTI
jgi:predicted dehydrogenase